MPTINHGLIVNKTDFWSRNFLKIAGTADFRRKNGISWISRAVLNIFSWNLAHWCKMATSKMWPSPIFKKHIFPAENAGNMPEKPVFWHFLEISSLVFIYFFAQTGILGMLNTWPSPIVENFFFRSKIPEICQKLPFLQIFIGLFPYISYFFHTKTFMISLFRSFVRSFVRSYFHYYQVGPISMWLVLCWS